MGGFSLSTAIAITSLVSFLIAAFMIALSRNQRSYTTSESYAWLAGAYGFNGIRLACQLLVISGITSVTILGDLFYIGFISSFWLGVQTYSKQDPLSPRLIAIPALLIVWAIFARSTGVPFPWLAIPPHFLGTIIFVASGYYVWSLHRSRANNGHKILALMMFLQGASTASYPFTRNTWFAPYGFSLFTLLATAIGIGFIISALQVEQLRLLDEMDARKHAEDARKKSLDLIECIMSNSPTGIRVFEGETGKCIHANKAIADMVGGTVETLLQQNFRSLTSWHDVGLDKIAETTLKDGTTRHHEALFQTSFGKSLMADYFVSRFELEGKPNLLFIASDISERKDLETQLIQAQKMESVGRLAGGIAHDFNNMLGVIIGHASIALMDTELNKKTQRHLVEINNAADRSADLTRQLLAFARKQAIEPKVLDLNVTIAGMLNMLQRLIGENIHLNWQPVSTVCQVKIDPAQVDQILANLCVNARDAIDNVGKIIIETGTVTIDEAYSIRHPEAEYGNYVWISTSDSGHGMDKETQKYIFEPFFTTKGVGEGTGLGLATIYGIVKQNNGFINVSSELGQGTTFTIYIPEYVGTSKPELYLKTSSDLLRGVETIMLVEDEPAILDMAAQFLKMQGYTVLEANSPGEAILFAHDYKDTIHLLITDVVMPEMNGRELATNLMAMYPHLKCLFMSGYTSDVITHHGVIDEGVYFIQKPFPLPALATKVRDVLDI